MCVNWLIRPRSGNNRQRRDSNRMVRSIPNYISRSTLNPLLRINSFKLKIFAFEFCSAIKNIDGKRIR